MASLDQFVSGGLLAKSYRQRTQRHQLAALLTECSHHLTVLYNRPSSDLLAGLCDRYGSDKGSLTDSGHAYPWPACWYTDVYSLLFAHCRSSITRVFECGVGTNNLVVPSNMGPTGKPGASLRVWRDYFPNALIVGADIDRDVLFQEDRIRTFYVDQTDPKAIALLWDEVGLDNFDLMIDDGLHTFDAGKCLFENSVSKLAPHGIYIIEDVDLADLRKYAEHFARSGFAADYLTWHRPESDRRDYNLVVIRRK